MEALRLPRELVVFIVPVTDSLSVVSGTAILLRLVRVEAASLLLGFHPIKAKVTL